MHRTNRKTLLALGPAYRGPARRDDPGDNPGTGGGNDGGEGGDGPGDGGEADDTGSGKPKIKGEYDQARAERTIAAAREGEKKAKAEAKALKERNDAILKAAGLTPDGKEDPAEQLKAAAADRDKATAKARQTAVELAVFRHAGKAGADPDAVLDSRGFLGQVADLDPDADDFGDKVQAALKAAVKANPKLAATPAGPPKRQGADHTGGSTGGRTRSKSLDSAVAKELVRDR